jgi:hypothetical protein
MPDEMRDAIKHESAQNQMTMTKFIRVAVEEKLRRISRQGKATAEADSTEIGKS